MRNKYEASCNKCKRTVKVGEGDTNKVNGRWVTEHINDDYCRHALMTQRNPHVHRAKVRQYDPYDDPHDDPYFDMTSADFNPDEGSRG